MSDKIPGIVSGAVSPFAGIISASPGILGTSRNTQDVKDRFNSAVGNAVEQAKGNVKTEGIDLGVRALDKVNIRGVNLGDVARGYLGQQNSKSSKTTGDPPYPNPNGWYANARKRIDPLVNLNWNISLPQIGVLQLPSYYVEDVSALLPTFEEFNITRYGKRDYFASFQDNPGFNIVCYEDAIGTTLAYFDLWRSRIRNLDGTFNPPASYQFDVIVDILNPIATDIQGVTGFSFSEVKIIYKNAFPTEISGYEFSSQGTDRIRPQVQMRCSDIIVIPNNYYNGATVGGPRLGLKSVSPSKDADVPLVETGGKSPIEFLKESMSAVKSFGKNVIKEELSNIPGRIKL